MTSSPPHALVLGAGVIGLTTAIRLAESGSRVTVWADGADAGTTSYAAGASWGPHLVADHPEVYAWGRATLTVHRDLAVRPGTGVRMATGVEASRNEIEVPPWAGELDVRMVGPDELPSGFRSGWRHTTPLIDMPTHLAYLRQRLRTAGGVVETRRVDTLAETDGIAPIVVNATGMGAAALTGDTDLTPIRGQVVVVANPGIDGFFVDAEDAVLTYYFAHPGVVVMGGQSVRGEWSTVPDPELTRAIVSRCARIEPRLGDAAILDVRVGLRPYRSRVRVEVEPRTKGTMIHNYGHGGAGVTLSWGCADEVLRLAADVF